jgi:hypothetical protein
MLIGTVLLFHYVIKNVRKNPIVLLPGISILIPYAFNILNNYGVISIPSSIIPLTFCVTFIAFIIASYRVKYSNLTNAMITDVFKAYKDGIILVDLNGVVQDYNNGIHQNFPFLAIREKKTTIKDLLETLGTRVSEKEPETLFEEVQDQTRKFSGGTFTLTTEKARQTFELCRSEETSLESEAGYTLTFSDITSYIKKENPV